MSFNVLTLMSMPRQAPMPCVAPLVLRFETHRTVKVQQASRRRSCNHPPQKVLFTGLMSRNSPSSLREVNSVFKSSRRARFLIVQLWPAFHIAAAASNAMVLPTFQHNNVPLPDGNSIRLLALEPIVSGEDSRLQARLIATTLDGGLPYEALSYTWGKPEFDHEIHLPEGILKITQNLACALRELRDSDGQTRMLLWVDAVCINQGDNEEKSWQVGLMGRIYETASSVRIWLGSGTDETKAAMGFLSGLANRAESLGVNRGVGTAYIGSHSGRLPTIEASPVEAGEILDAAVEAHVGELFARSWFERLWVVQELTLAKEAVVQCGPDAISWVGFAQALTVTVGSLKTCGARNALVSAVVAWELVKHRDEFRMNLHPGMLYTDPMVALRSIRYQMRNKKCQDDRDRVYGMLSMIRGPARIVPDYSKTVSQVYTEFANRYAEFGQLFEAGLSRRGLSSLGDTGDILDPDYLLSWVPDLRTTGSSTAWSPAFSTGFETSGVHQGTMYRIAFLPGVLRITGVVFDKFSNYELFPGTTAPPYFRVVEYINERLGEFRKIEALTYHNGDSLLRAFQVTIAGGSSVNAGHPLQDLVCDLPGEQRVYPGCTAQLLHLWEVYERNCLQSTGEVSSMHSEPRAAPLRTSRP
ncbi:heterokaryon incompatibility protein-domain-containing protein [Echria macrotheca]|uniref:Heterokaryon incompatibility protein-domain-containing protein n=1 Tax=Echria macrotheca TaxID=438768 RepID=A0AAJ0BFV4_9PEZI|nr:heterokaryon incompatibility protein-domain-containing protein [Echria macrotheca]